MTETRQPHDPSDWRRHLGEVMRNRRDLASGSCCLPGESLAGSIAVVIVNYRTAALAVDCLRSITADGWLPSRGRVIVVDNASGDDSLEVIGQAVVANGWSEWVELIPAERNGGFAYGNNVGIRAAFGMESAAGSPRPRVSASPRLLPDYVLLLNPDTVVRPGAIETLVAFLEEHPKAGICGARLLDAEGRPQCSGFRFPSLLGELESGARLGLLSRLLSSHVIPLPLSDVATEVDWVSGAAFVIRREVIEQIGLLDERYFMYYEEVDYCRVARTAGWEVRHVPQAEIVHLEGAASGIAEHRKQLPKYWYASRRRYFLNTYGRWYTVAAEAAFLMGHLTWCVRRRSEARDRDPVGRTKDGWRWIVRPGLAGSD